MNLHATNIKMYLNGLFVALTCPCHAIFYVYLLSGTTLGAFLSDHEILFMSFLGLLFPFFVLMVLKYYHQIKMQKAAEASGEACSIVCKTCVPENKRQ